MLHTLSMYVVESKGCGLQRQVSADKGVSKKYRLEYPKALMVPRYKAGDKQIVTVFSAAEHSHYRSGAEYGQCITDRSIQTDVVTLRSGVATARYL